MSTAADEEQAAPGHSPGVSAQSGTDCATCLLVLLTGLPAAGKSSFLDALQSDKPCCTTLPDCVTLAGVFRLDDFMDALSGAPSYHSVPRPECTDADGSATFSPATWREAERALYAAVQGALLRSHAAPAQTATSLIVVEDNMHYYSMRERYWRLCRQVDAEVTAARGPATRACQTLLLELRFTVPLDVCVQRNEARRGVRQGGARSSSGGRGVYTPLHVLHAVHARFDHCLPPPASCTSPNAAASITKADARPERGSCGGSSDPPHCWQVTATTQPWVLMTLHPVHAGEGQPELRWPTVEEECDSFVRLLAQPSSALREALCVQCSKAAAQRRAAARRQVASSPLDAAAQRALCDTALHHADLELRAGVRGFFLALQGEEGARYGEGAAADDMLRLRKEVQRMKRTTLSALRRAVEHDLRVQDVAPNEDAREVVMSRFYDTLAHLRCGGPAAACPERARKHVV